MAQKSGQPLSELLTLCSDQTPSDCVQRETYSRAIIIGGKAGFLTFGLLGVERTMLVVESIAVAIFMMIGVFGAILAVSHSACRRPRTPTRTVTVHLKGTTEN